MTPSLPTNFNNPLSTSKSHKNKTKNIANNYEAPPYTHPYQFDLAPDPLQESDMNRPDYTPSDNSLREDSANNPLNPIYPGSPTTPTLPPQVPPITSPPDPANLNQRQAALLANYAKYLGKPYVWGATGPSRYDCSGFTQAMFKEVGINLPRVSRDQSRYGQDVPALKDMIPGDLIFFDTVGQKDGNVTHVGIYIGNGQMVHATDKPHNKVVVGDLFKSKHYMGSIVNIRRP